MKNNPKNENTSQRKKEQTERVAPPSESDEDDKEEKPQEEHVRNENDLYVVKSPPINKFIPAIAPEISLFSTTTVYGRRRSGKTVFLKWFMQAFKHLIPWAWCFTKTKFNTSYESWLPSKFIITDFDADVLTQVMDRQEQAIEHHLTKDRDFNAVAWINWDDYNGKDIRYNEALANYYFTGRHYWTLNTFGTQYITNTPPAIRSNTDVAILFNTDYGPAIEHYHKDFAGKMNYYDFIRLFNRVVEVPHQFLAIDNTPNIPYERKFFYGKAEMLDEDFEYIFGCPEFWRDNKKQLFNIQSGTYKDWAEEIAAQAEYRPPKNKQRSLKIEGQNFPVNNPNQRW